MSLRTRLFLSILALVGSTIVLLGFFLRFLLVRAEERRFEEAFEKARGEVLASLERESNAMDAVLGPLCAHDPVVDSALVGLTSGDLERRLLSIRLRIEEGKKALRFDALGLYGDDERWLAGDRITVDRSRGSSGRASYVDDERALLGFCEKKGRSRRVVLRARRSVVPMLADAGRTSGLEIGFEPRENSPVLEKSFLSPVLGERRLFAAQDRTPLERTLAELTKLLGTATAIAIVVALAAGLWLARSIARPILAFSEKARRTLVGRPEPLPVTGGPELGAAALAFNQTLEELSALQKRLAVSERAQARRDVAREVAHEIKNPLSPIQATIETLRRLRGRRAAEFDEYFEEATSIVLAEVKRMRELVRAFSEYASLPESKPERFSVAPWLESLVLLHREEGLDLEFENSLGDDSLVGDPSQLSIVLQNLLKNAKEAVAGAEERRIVVRLREVSGAEGSLVGITVEDSGPGVPPEVRGRLFQPGATTKATGNGIGLALSLRIAREHGGTLELGSGPLGGAVFELRLPR